MSTDAFNYRPIDLVLEALNIQLWGVVRGLNHLTISKFLSCTGDSSLLLSFSGFSNFNIKLEAAVYPVYALCVSGHRSVITL